jgi:hypothetical protein
MSANVVEIPAPQPCFTVPKEKLIYESIQREEEPPKFNRFLRIADEYWLLEWFGLVLAFGSVAGIAALLGSSSLFVHFNGLNGFNTYSCVALQDGATAGRIPIGTGQWEEATTQRTCLSPLTQFCLFSQLRSSRACSFPWVPLSDSSNGSGSKAATPCLTLLRLTRLLEALLVQ